ncbi:helix-turn-helix transcriptional regulator [Clostridium sp. YIM B02505]|uniref:Helix-turn-helix transcriptional regulator n=1 Tax=Clostridium yunnanense TaxID=2800325 RepID=A0ABS1EMC7_9CLOT|nr:helix-turn-helix transcriptional regulator [Clostridium yunnanense]MBK1810531.1 helix-turn-helix transcriptional regulator [Clostridium yunnanense]
MEFYNPSEKIRRMRKKFRVNQAELEGVNMTRAFISMMESGKRNVSKASSKHLAERFNEIAKRISVNLNLDDEYFSRQPQEDARYYIENELKNENNHKKLEELIEVGKKYNLDDLLATVYKLDAEKYFEEKEYVKAFELFNYALGKYKELKDDAAQVYIYNILGNCKARRNEQEESIFYYKQAILYAKQADNKFYFYRSSANLAMSHFYIKQYEKCIDIINEVILSNSEKVEYKILTDSRITRANALSFIGRENEAIQEYLNLIDENKDKNDVLLAYCYNNVGEYYYAIGNYQESLKYISEAQRLKNKVSKETLANTLNTKAKVFFKQGLYDESIMLFELAISMAEQYQRFDMLFENNKDLVNAYESREDFNKIEEAMCRYLEILESNDVEKGKSFALYKLVEVTIKQNNSNKAINLLNRLQALLVN